MKLNLINLKSTKKTSKIIPEETIKISLTPERIKFKIGSHSKDTSQHHQTNENYKAPLTLESAVILWFAESKKLNALLALYLFEKIIY